MGNIPHTIYIYICKVTRSHQSVQIKYTYNSHTDLLKASYHSNDIQTTNKKGTQPRGLLLVFVCLERKKWNYLTRWIPQMRHFLLNAKWATQGQAISLLFKTSEIYITSGTKTITIGHSEHNVQISSHCDCLKRIQ